MAQYHDRDGQPIAECNARQCIAAFFYEARSPPRLLVSREVCSIPYTRELISSSLNCSTYLHARTVGMASAASARTAKVMTEEFQRQVNEVRPHPAFGQLTPAESKRKKLSPANRP